VLVVDIGVPRRLLEEIEREADELNRRKAH
jgi:hypothetical protein